MNVTRGVIPLIAALVGVGLMSLSFLSGISAALEGNGSGAGLWQVLFVLAAVLVLASLVLAIINLVRKRSIVVSIITFVVALAPFVVVIGVWITAATQVAR